MVGEPTDTAGVADQLAGQDGADTVRGVNVVPDYSHEGDSGRCPEPEPAANTEVVTTESVDGPMTNVTVNWIFTSLHH
jgi:hypothetical protein